MSAVTTSDEALKLILETLLAFEPREQNHIIQQLLLFIGENRTLSEIQASENLKTIIDNRTDFFDIVAGQNIEKAIAERMQKKEKTTYEKNYR
jgi:hypothetical protein